MEQPRFGHIMADHEGVISRVDPAFCAIVGMEPADLVGRHLLDITHPSDRERNRTAVERLLTRHEPFRIDKQYVRPDGTTVAVRNHVSIFPDEVAPRLIAATEAMPDWQYGLSEKAREQRHRSVFEALDRIAEAGKDRH